MISTYIFSVTLSFSIGLLIGAGTAWGLVMYVWEPIEPEENRTDFDSM